MSETLGKYHIHSELGKGGFATVYQAVDTTLDREVALKVLDPLLMRDATWAERFRREAKMIAALKHPAIVSIYEVNEVEGRLYLAMELAAGGSLAGAIAARGRLPWAETLTLLKPVCEALDYAHGQGVIHRDLKPANILLTADRQPLLTDFGFARLLGDNSMSLSLSGGILGTPAYIAPEVWELDAADAPADIYALGCIVYEMLAGEVLFQSKTPMQAVRAHDQGPKYTETWPEGTPDGLAATLNKALARDPATRYPTAGTFWHALNALEAEAETARQAAQLAAVADQWRVETESAMQAGEWSAAKLTVGRWLKVAPGNKDALKAQRQIEAAVAEQARQQQEAKQERQQLAMEHERQKQAAAQIAAEVAQRRTETEAAIQADEWSAAKLAVGRWLAVAPEDQEAIGLQTEIARRMAEAERPATPPSDAQDMHVPTQPVATDKAVVVQENELKAPVSATVSTVVSKKSKPSHRVPIWGWIVLLVVCISGLLWGGFSLLDKGTAIVPTTAPTQALVVMPGNTITQTAILPTAAPTQAFAVTPEHASYITQLPGKPKIAILAPLSGDIAIFGESIRDGVMLAVSEWNAAGNQVELVIEDSQCSSEVARNAANKVIDQDMVRFIIGDACSSASIPISEVSMSKGAMQICPTSTNALVTVDESGNTKDLIFRTCFVDPIHGTVAAKFATDVLNAKTAAVLLQGNDYVRGMAESFRANFEANGGTIVAWENYNYGDSDFSAILSIVKNSNPDILYLPDYYSTVNLIAAQARELGITATMMGGDGWDSSDLDKAAVDGGYFTNHFSPDDTRPEAQVFVQAYQAMYGDTPDALAALGYDSANLLFMAMAAAGTTTDPVAVARSLESGTFDVVTGEIHFDAQHNPIKHAVVLQVKNGTVQYVTSIKP